MTMLNYLLEVNAVIIVFYLLYKGLLANEQVFQFNRAFLLFGISIAWIVPIVELPLLPSVSDESYFYSEFLMDTIKSVPISTRYESEISTTTFTFEVTLNIVYVLIASMFLIRLASQLYRIVKSVRTGETHKEGYYTLVYTEQNHAPSSFFQFIFWNAIAEKLDGDDKLILAHEQVHVKQLHSADLLLVEIIRCICWFNPILLLYKKAIETNQEYIVDALLCKQYNANNYQKLLLIQTANQLNLNLYNYFNHSTIKNRIAMIKKRKTTMQPWKFITLVVGTILTLGLLACEEQEYMADMPLTDISVDESLLDPNNIQSVSVSKPGNGDGIIEITFKPDSEVDKITLVKKAKKEAPREKRSITIDKAKGIGTAIFEDGSVTEFLNLDSEAKERYFASYVNSVKLHKNKVSKQENEEAAQERNEALSNDGEEVFAIVEDLPEPIDGIENVQESITNALTATRLVPDENKIFIRFVVKKDTELSSIEIVRGVENLSASQKTELTQAVQKAMQKHRWEAGRQDGKKVNTRVVMPIDL